MRLKPGYIKITDKIRKELLEQKTRTGVAEWTLLKGDKVIDSSIVSSWLLEKTKQANHKKLEYVLNKWKALPNKDDAFVELTDEKRQEIRDIIGNRNRRIVFGSRSDLPEGFNSQLLARMTSHKTTSLKKVKREYVDYIFRVCELRD